MSNWTHRCMIVPADQAKFASGLSFAIAGESGSGMWTTPLSPTGAAPPTHFISSGLIDAQFAALMPLMTYPADAEPIFTPGRPEVAAYLATEAGLIKTYEEVAALFAVCDSSDQEAQVAMARLGLVRVTEAME